MMSVRLERLQQHVGEVVGLDLVNGAQVVCQIEAIVDFEVVCKNLHTFTLSIMPRNPSLPASPSNPPEGRISNAPYGSPLYATERKTNISIEHIVMILKLPDDMKKAYQARTSGLVPASGATLDQLGEMMKNVPMFKGQ